MGVPTIFRSTDASAPVLHGNAGSLIAVLDGCLVTGYGSKTALGWAKAFSGTNLASYRAAAGARHYLDVDDSGPDATALGRNARVRGYETMTAVATGTNLFPTTTQVTTCVGVVKSTATGTTARPWLLIGDDRTFYLFVESAGTDPPNLSSHNWTAGFYFGEILSALTGDLYRTIIGYQSTTTAVVTAGVGAFGQSIGALSTAVVNENMPRAYTGGGAALWAAMNSNLMWQNAQADVSVGQLVFPNPVDGGVYLNAIDIVERGSGTTAVAPTGIRGRMRGMYGCVHSSSGWNDQDTFSGIGDFSGKTFIAIKLSGMLAFETTSWAASS